ncbi:MAG: exodeoxyribonuclease V subunit alpha [Kiritimatiellae bacterium]|nr:exodeoxyribonuclease V subunit alpha [Kiritimatiellia bacterium]
MNMIKKKLRALKDAGALDLYAWHFACRIEQMFTDGMDERLFLVAALVAQHSICAKHICLDYAMVSRLSDILTIEAEDDMELDAQSCWGVLDAASCACAVGRGGGEYKPLIVEGSRIYLHRYHDYEVRLAEQLNERIKMQLPPAQEINSAELLIESFKLDKWQVAAVQSTLDNPFNIITGGPGTGKTTILCVIITELLRRNPHLRIHACAPTGKAQARMKEAVDAEFRHNIRGDVREQLLLSLTDPAADTLPVSYSTVHRLLGYNPGTGACTYSGDKLLETDVVVVDEVSMADLAMTIKLFSAIPKSAKVILIGDKDQLAAVEMGAVLGDIYRAWKDHSAVACLKKSHRFGDDTEIGKLKDLINTGDAAGVVSLLKSIKDTDESALSYEVIEDVWNCAGDLKRILKQNTRFASFVKAPNIAEAFRCFDSFRILCAVRRGPLGVEHINARMMKIMQIKPYQHGYPVMVTANDYANQLFNGDIGLCFKCADNASVRVYFPGLDGQDYRSFGVAQLPAHEPVFAMTIHKAQGSGFDRVLVILPDQDNPILTKELLYTGLTRTRKHCTIWGTEQVLQNCVSRATQRMSGLAERLLV